MNAADVIAYAGDGEIACPDCAGDDDHPIFADTEIRDLYCQYCDSYFDWDWGDWLLCDRRPGVIREMEASIHED